MYLLPLNMLLLPYPVSFLAAVTEYSKGKCKIKCDFLLAVETLKKIVKNPIQRCTLNRRICDKWFSYFALSFKMIL